MSASFEEILERAIKQKRKELGKRRTPAFVLETLREKGLSLRHSIELRLEEGTLDSSALNAIDKATLSRVEDIIENSIARDVLEMEFFTKTRKNRKRFKVDSTGFLPGLRDKRGAFVSPSSLASLLNTVLYKHVMSNMGKPSLVNRTGRFAHSAHITSIRGMEKFTVERELRASIFFSYMTRPYGVFENTEPWAAGGARSPSRLITQAVRDSLREILNPESYIKSMLFSIEETE